MIGKFNLSWKFIAPTITLALVILLAPGIDAQTVESSPSDEVPEVRFESLSDSGVYQVSAWPEDGYIPIGKMHRWVVELMTPDGQPIYPARMSVGGGMEAHQHGLPTQPQLVAYGGDGVYLIDGVRFNMAGAWRLSFVIDAEFGVDRVDFELDLKF